MVELAGTTLEPRYLEAARSLLELIDTRFRGDGGLLRDVAPSLYDGVKVESLSTASYPLEDSPHLSANSAAALAALRLATLTEEQRWKDFGVALIDSMSSRIGGAGL